MRTILVTEDRPTILKLVSTILEERGFIVTKAWYGVNE
jgi:CheY-like chemotaxis protein